MFLADAYIYATNLALALQKKEKSVQGAIFDSSTEHRQKGVKVLVKLARNVCNILVSQKRFWYLFFYLFTRYAPAKYLMNQMEQADDPNKDFLKHLDEKIYSPEEQKSMQSIA